MDIKKSNRLDRKSISASFWKIDENKVNLLKASNIKLFRDFFFIDIKISNRVDSQYILGKGEKEW